MKLVDCFLFNDELDLLELRLEEIGDLVDRVVLVEHDRDFQQHPKELHYRANKDRFKKWAAKIVDCPSLIEDGPHPIIEHSQRRALEIGIGHLDFNDMFMLGDVDEIPSREAIQYIRKTPPNRPMVMRQHLYYYRVTNHAGWWRGTIVMPRGLGKVDLQQVRDMRNNLPCLPVNTAGWHFSWLGDSADVKKKLTNIDVEGDAAIYGQLPDIPDPEKDSERIDRIVALGDDLFGLNRQYQTMIIEPGVLQPQCIEEWLVGKDKYR